MCIFRFSNFRSENRYKKLDNFPHEFKKALILVDTENLIMFDLHFSDIFNLTLNYWNIFLTI